MKSFLEVFLKLVLTAVFLPLLYASIKVFDLHLSTYPARFESFFFLGVTSFVVVYLFLFKFHKAFEMGHRVVASVLSFCAPLDRFLAHLLPLYFLIVFAAYTFIVKFLGMLTYQNSFLFAAGVTIAMNLINAADDVRDEEENVFKIGYFLKMSVIGIVNIYLVVLFLDVAIGILTFPSFFSLVVEHAQDCYLSVLKLLNIVH